VDHTADTSLVTFRFRNAGTRMYAAEQDFDADGRPFRAGTLIVPDADSSRLEPMLSELGLSAVAVPTIPDVPRHDLDLPRIGYVHTWTRTQDEGWWRAALDTYGIPYVYLADQELAAGNLRAQFDVILFPHVGGTAVSQVNGLPRTSGAPLPYRKTDTTPNLGTLDSSDDIRGGMGIQGLAELAKFVQEGGTLITEGSTATIFPAYGITAGVTVEEPAQLFVRGSILRARVADRRSPIAYGFDGPDLPVYFNQAPVLNVAGGAGSAIASPDQTVRNPNAGLGQIVTPNAVPLRLSPFEPGDHQSGSGTPPAAAERPSAGDVEAVRQRTEERAGRNTRPRVVIQFPAAADDMLLSGTLANGQFLANRAAAVDVPLGEGHVVMFAIRPFWRWQTHGTYTLGFNAIMNWNDLDAGR
jgi:hypothetical protein